MEPLHMNRLCDSINRLRSGESERRIARDMGISRTTVRKSKRLPICEGIEVIDAGKWRRGDTGSSRRLPICEAGKPVMLRLAGHV
jgi:response regulator of citrate/malate metabolism